MIYVVRFVKPNSGPASPAAATAPDGEPEFNESDFVWQSRETKPPKWLRDRLKASKARKKKTPVKSKEAGRA